MVSFDGAMVAGTDKTSGGHTMTTACTRCGEGLPGGWLAQLCAFCYAKPTPAKIKPKTLYVWGKACAIAYANQADDDEGWSYQVKHVGDDEGVAGAVIWYVLVLDDEGIAVGAL